MVGFVRNTGATGRIAPTAPFEEHPQVSAQLRDLSKRAQQGGASSIMFLPARGVRFDAYAFAYHTNLAKELNVPQRPASGVLRGTIVINISGHATGGHVDRVVAWAESELQKKGVRIGDDATKFLALRNAVETAVRVFQSDYQRTHQSVTIDAGALGEVEFPRAKYDALQSANKESSEYNAGNQALRKYFAATNTYNVRIRGVDGQEHVVRNIPRNDPTKIEYATRIPVEVAAGADGVALLQAWPTGSAEVAGYREAREYAIHIGGSQFDFDKAVEAAEKYQAAHPEIRWDTDDESDDLEKHHVSPSPYPYQDF